MDPQHLHLPLPPHSTSASPQALALSPDHLAHQHPAHAGHCSHTYGHSRQPGVTHQGTLTTHHHSNPDRDVSPRRQNCDGQEGRYTQSWASSPPQQLSTGGLATSGRSSRSSSRSGHSSSSSSGCDSWGGSKGVLGMRYKAGAGCWDEGGENGEGEGSGAGPGVHMEGSPCSQLARSGTSDSTGIGPGPHSSSGRAGLVCVPAHQPSAPGECEVSGGGSEGVAAEGGGGGKERQEQHSGGPAEGSSGGGGGWGWEEQQGCASPTTSTPVQQPGRHTQGTRRRSASSASLLSLVGPGAAPRVGRCLTQQAACTSAPNAPTSLLPGLSPRRCHSPRSLPSPVARIGSEPLLPPRPRPPRPALPARGQLSCPEPPALQPAQLAAEQSPSALLPAPDVPLVPAAMAGPPAVAPTAAAPAPPPAALAALSTLPTAQQPTQDLEPEPQAALAPPVVPSQPPHQLDSPHGGIRLSPSPRLIPSPTPSPRLGSGRAPSPHASPSPSPYRGLSPSPCQRSSPSPGPSPRSAPGSPLMQRLGTLLMQGVAITAAGVLGAGLSQVARGDASPPKRSRHRTGTPPPASPRVAACPLSTPTSPAQHLGAGPARLLPGCPQPGPGMCEVSNSCDVVPAGQCETSPPPPGVEPRPGAGACEQVDMEIRSWRGRERGRGATPRRSMRPDESELRLSPKELREERARSRITSRPDGVW
ncbi:hypothetical protein QJQ45_016075 [Haematococcus lacustris]|nr:hypothetical protein QJQ45_016075 [Haematococcus lacustris]